MYTIGLQVKGQGPLVISIATSDKALMNFVTSHLDVRRAKGQPIAHVVVVSETGATVSKWEDGTVLSVIPMTPENMSVLKPEGPLQ